MQRQRGGRAQLGGRTLHAFRALDFFRSDIEQAHTRRGPFGHDPGIGSAHDRELHQIARIAFGIGAQIEHDHIIFAQRRQQCGESGPVNSRHRSQRQFGHGHQRTGVAGADRSPRIAHLHGIDREPHRGGPGAAQRLSRLLLARHDIVSVQDFGRAAHVGVAFKRALDSRFVAYQQEFETVVAAPGKRRALDHHPNAFIPAHRIDGDTRQGHFSALQLNGLRARRRRPGVRCSGRNAGTDCADA